MGVLDLLASASDASSDTVDTAAITTVASALGRTSVGGAVLAVPITAQVMLEEQIKEYTGGVAGEGSETHSGRLQTNMMREDSKRGLAQACAGVCKLLDPILADDVDVEQLVYENPERLNKLIEQKFGGDGTNPEHFRELEAEFSVILLGEDPPADVELDFDPDDEEALKAKLLELFDTDDEREAIQLFALYEQFLAAVTEQLMESVVEDDLSEESREVLEQLETSVEQMHWRVDEFVDLYLRLGVRNQGFKQLTVRDFQIRDSFGDRHKSPLEAWKGGFTFAELADETEDGTPYYFQRPLPEDHDLRSGTDEAETISDAVVERLSDGHNLVLLGEPGMGKSHLCQLAATEWVDCGYGEVFYRQTSAHGQGTFDDNTELEGAIRNAQDGNDGHVLVVVEDATRDQSALIYEVMRTFWTESQADVSFLLDSRPHEWEQYTNRHRDRENSPYGFLDEEDSYLEEHAVPPVSKDDCKNAIEVFNRTTRGYYGSSPERLYETVSNEATGRAELLALIDTLIREGSSDDRPPIADDAITVHKSIWHSIDPDDETDRLYYEVVIGSMLLSAAEIGVQRSLLYALAENPQDDLRYIESLLEGTSAESQARSVPVPYELPEMFVFPTDGKTEHQRSRHPKWAMSFLTYHIDSGDIGLDFHEVVVDVVGKMAGLADSSQKRQGIRQHLESCGIDPTYLETFEEDPAGAASALLRELYQLATQEESLQPLFGARETGDGWGEPTVFDSGIAAEAIPESCADRLTYELLLVYSETITDWDATDEQKEAYRRFLEELTNRAAENLESPGRQRITALTARELADLHTSWEETQSAYRDAIESYQAIDDRQQVAETQRNLAKAAQTDSTVEWEAVEAYYQEAIETYRAIGDQHGVAKTQQSLAEAARLKQSVRWDALEGYYQQAIDAFEAIDNQQQVAETERNLAGAAREESGVSWDETEAYYEQAIATFEAIGDWGAVARTQQHLASAAEAASGVGWDAVERYYREAIETYREIGDQHGVAETRQDLAGAAEHAAAVEWATVEAYYQETIETYQEIGDQQAVATVRSSLAEAAQFESRVEWETVEAYYQEAVETYRDIGDQHGVARVQGQLATAAKRASGVKWEAVETYHQAAIETSREIGDRRGVANTQQSLATAAEDAPGVEWEAVETYYQAAIDTYREIGDQQEVADTQRRLARVARGEPEVAWEAVKTYYEQAIDSFEAIGYRSDWSPTVGSEQPIPETKRELAKAAAHASDPGWDEVEGYYQEAIGSFERTGTERGVAETYSSFAVASTTASELSWQETRDSVDSALANACACESADKSDVDAMFSALIRDLESLAEAALDADDPETAHEWIDVVADAVADRGTDDHRQRLDEIRDSVEEGT